MTKLNEHLTLSIAVSTSRPPSLPQAAISMLKQEYKETPTLPDALKLAVKILNKTLDSTKLNSEKGVSIMSAGPAALLGRNEPEQFLIG